MPVITINGKHETIMNFDEAITCIEKHMGYKFANHMKAEYEKLEENQCKPNCGKVLYCDCCMEEIDP
ncbi:hypothetical protein LJC10_00640 [Selenomonadales bacterium OttesenSCG-928-I06]|nr:hypothetical protein [Selenomonadales bacterium OttesenSCG-928-I06]